MQAKNRPSNLREFTMNENTSPKATPAQNPQTEPKQTIQSREFVSKSHSSLREHTENNENLWKKWTDELASERVQSQFQNLTTPNIPTQKSENTPTPLPKHGISWSQELADEERRMESEGVVDYNSPFNKRDYLQQETIRFLEKLRSQFRSSMEQFNQARRSPAHTIHLYRISNTQADFMLYRNGVKLLVSGEKSGRITFSFNQYLGQVYNPQGQNKSIEIEAGYGALQQLIWSLRGERVETADLVRYFFTEFAKQSIR